jgi:two-component system, cell cycle response regulator DivK
MNKRDSVKLIYVVDDDYPSYLLIEELFKDSNLLLRHITDGREMMDLFESGPVPDLIIMDIQLPGMNGIELTRRIKIINPSIPVIACTSYAMHGDRERCLESGCDEYISKPIDLDFFLGIVGKYI